MSKLAIILIGPQGSGKGTQAAILRQKHHLSYISGGNIARDLGKLQNSLGANVRQLMNDGQLLPDETLNSGASDAIKRANDRSLLFDGYPRTFGQAEFVSDLLSRLGYHIIVIELTLDDATSVERIKSRFVCSKCGSIIYADHRHFITAIQRKRHEQHLCVHCGGILIKRADDTESAVRQRLKLYHHETKPVIDYFKHHNLLHSVDARPNIETVNENVETVLDEQIKQ